MKLSFELFLELSNCKTYLNLWKLQVDWDQFQFHLSEFGKVFLCDDQTGYPIQTQQPPTEN